MLFMHVWTNFSLFKMIQLFCGWFWLCLIYGFAFYNIPTESYLLLIPPLYLLISSSCQKCNSYVNVRIICFNHLRQPFLMIQSLVLWDDLGRDFFTGRTTASLSWDICSVRNIFSSLPQIWKVLIHLIYDTSFSNRKYNN